MSSSDLPKGKNELAGAVVVELDIEETLLARIDAVVPGLSTGPRREKVAEAVRALILSGITALEEQRAQEGVKTPRTGQAP